MVKIELTEEQAELLFDLVEDGIQYRWEHELQYKNAQTFYNKLRDEVA